MKRELVRNLGIAGPVVAIATWAATTSAQGSAMVAQPAATAVPTHEVVSAYRGPNRALLGSGIALLGLSYVPAVVIGAQSTQSADQKLYIPVAGPWLDLANRPPCSGADACASGESGNRALIAVDGVFQGVGALLVVGSILMPERQQVVITAKATDKPEVHFSPAQLGPGGYGVSAFGRF